MGKIKNINIQLDPGKRREARVIEILDGLKDKGINYKESVINALLANNDIMGELNEIKMMIKNMKVVELPEPEQTIKTIKPSGEKIPKDDLNSF